jgi:murein DD-endopeptidase MepM/ murein hydrolase activator NlpD
MDKYSLIVVSDETAPVRRFELPKSWLRRGAAAGIVTAIALLVLLVDYVRVRIDNRELDGLRTETVERRARVAEFQEKLHSVDRHLAQIQEFERKIRIIANLPGSAGTGGGEVTAVGDSGGDLDAAGGGQGGPEAPLDVPGAPSRLPAIAPETPEPQRVSLLGQAAVYLGEVADGQTSNLEELVEALESKRDFLASSPSVWPAKGWLTSRYGYRTSPFTNQKSFHAGIDIAGAIGTEITAPARGRVVFSGKRGPLGNAIIIDHGYGIRTQYGHNKELFVKKGDTVERGEKIASLGNSGRSTGPHLHYVVEVQGKTRNPLDYIFD